MWLPKVRYIEKVSYLFMYLDKILIDGLASSDKERAPSKLVRVSDEGYLRLNSKVSCSRDKNNRDRKLSILSRMYMHL